MNSTHNHLPTFHSDTLHFFAVYFCMGYYKLTCKRDYWALGGINPTHWMSDIYPCNHFEYIWWNILVDSLFSSKLPSSKSKRKSKSKPTKNDIVDVDFSLPDKVWDIPNYDEEEGFWKTSTSWQWSRGGRERIVKVHQQWWRSGTFRAGSTCRQIDSQNQAL